MHVDINWGVWHAYTVKWYENNMKKNLRDLQVVSDSDDTFFFFF